MASILTYKTTQAGVSERERTRYAVRYRKPNGKQTMKRGFKLKRDAERFLNEIERSKHTGEYVDPTAGKEKLGTMAQDWLNRKQVMLKKSSYNPLETSWRVHVAPVWEHVNVKDVQTTDVEQWISDMLTGGSASGRPAVGATITIRAHEVLAGILDDAVKQRRIPKNPARGVVLPRKQGKPKIYLTHEQVFALAKETQRAPLILTLAYTGIRWGEAGGLQVKHIDFTRRRLKIERNLVELSGGLYDITTPKSRKARSVPFPAFLAPYLLEAVAGKQPGETVFAEPTGEHLRRPHSRDGWFYAAQAAAGISERITPHDLRHSAASFAISSGANVKAVQRMLGHESASMTLDVYAELFDTDLDSVAAALDVLVRADESLATVLTP